MNIFCKHDWKLISETVTVSKFQLSMEASESTGLVGKIKIPHQLCCADRKHIQIVSCDKCGKLKRFVENI